MKTLQIIILVSVLLLEFTVFKQKEVFPSFDSKLIALWQSAYHQDVDKSIASIKELQAEWKTIKKDVAQIRYSQFNNSEFIETIDNSIQTLEKFSSQKKVLGLEEFTYLILWEFRAMRNCVEIEDYPIDNLLEVHDVYNEVHYTVHDQMMGLLHWFEFQEIVDNLVENWDRYDCLSTDQIKANFGNIDLKKHEVLKSEVNYCLNDFIKSLESGYTPDFEIPCDEMGNAMRELIWLYGQNKLIN